MSNSILHIVDASAGYEREAVISNVTLEVFPKQITALVGNNAAGKTTFFRGLFGIEAWLIAKKFLWMSRPVNHLRDGISPVESAWVHQDRPIFPGLTAGESIRVATVAKVSAKQKEHLFEEVIDRMPRRLKQLLPRAVDKLSGGEQALVSIAQGLINKPKILCLDEPAAMIDAATLPAIKELLVDYANEQKAGCLIIEHRMSFLEDCVDHCVHI